MATEDSLFGFFESPPHRQHGEYQAKNAHGESLPGVHRCTAAYQQRISKENWLVLRGRRSCANKGENAENDQDRAENGKCQFTFPRHASNETELSHRWREQALLLSLTLKSSES